MALLLLEEFQHTLAEFVNLNTETLFAVKETAQSIKFLNK